MASSAYDLFQKNKEEQSRRYSMFTNYHATACSISGGDMAVYGRLMFILNTYAFEGDVPEDLTQDELNFILPIRTSVDATLNNIENGRKGGRPKKKVCAAAEIPEQLSETAMDEEAEKEAGEGPKKPRSRMRKPTVEEIRAYCGERGNAVNAQQFFDFYESKGWKVGNSAMKDWKASVRTWEQKDGFKVSPTEKLDTWN